MSAALNKREVELLLMNLRVGGYVNRAEIIFYLCEHITLSAAKRARDFGVYSERGLLDAIVVERFRKAARFFENLVADCLRRLNQSSALAVRAWRAERSL